MTDFLKSEVDKAEAYLKEARGPIRGWMGANPFTTLALGFAIGAALVGWVLVGLVH